MDTKKEEDIKKIEEKLTEIMAENWRDSKVAKAIAAGVKDKIDEMRWKMSKGYLKNTAGTRGYLEALLDLHYALEQSSEEAEQETQMQIEEEKE